MPRPTPGPAASPGVVYVDSGPLGEGGVINDELPAENGEVPLPDWALFEQEDLVDLDDDLRSARPSWPAWGLPDQDETPVIRGVTPAPFGILSSPLDGPPE